MQKCSVCADPACGYNVGFYHDHSVISFDAVCEVHSVKDRAYRPVEYDEYGNSVYRPDPIFIWMDTFDNPQTDAERALVRDIHTMLYIEAILQSRAG